MKRIRNNRWLMVIVVLTLHCSLLTNHAVAQQCGIENTAFSSGERLVYDLHFNWKFVWFKVGQATMNTDLTTFEGKKAWRSSLVTGGNKKLDKFFTMRDTLLSYCSTDLSPLYFRKGAREGKRYYVDELWYTYPNNTCKLRMHRIDADGEEHWKDAQYKDCIYDMMSIFLRSRNFDASKMTKGDVIPMPITDAKHRTDTWLVYQGKENYKIDGTSEKFRCLVFSFMEREDGKTTELIKFFVTDDDNHMPVRLDMNLSFGSAKAYLRAYQGVRNPLTSKL